MTDELDLFTQQTNFVKEQKLSFSSCENIPIANRNENYYEKIMPTFSNRQSEVINAMMLMNSPCTMHDVANFLKVPLNTISGRFGELVKKNKIKAIGRTEDRKSLYKLI